MFEDHNDTLYDILREGAHLLPEQLEELKSTHENTGKSFADAVIDAGELERNQLLQLIADTLGCEFMDPLPITIEQEVIQSLASNLARMYGIVPVRADSASIEVLAKDPFNNHIIDDLTFTLNKDIIIVVGDPDGIQSLIVNNYGDEDASVEDLLKEMGGVGLDRDAKDTDEISDAELSSMANDTSIIRFVNVVIEQATTSLPI